MLTSFFRTVILLLFVIVSLRVMGKRQIGELQPGELVVTILLSQIAATPMQDNDIPLLHTLVCILTLAGVEVLLSVFAMKSETVRTLIDGRPVPVVREGKPDQQALKKLRFTIDDLMEGLRQKNVFDLSQVHTAIAETNGTLSVLLKAENQPAAAGQINKAQPEKGMPYAVIADGKLREAALGAVGLDRPALDALLEKENVTLPEVFLLTVDRTGNIFFVRKESVK